MLKRHNEIIHKTVSKYLMRLRATTTFAILFIFSSFQFFGQNEKNKVHKDYYENGNIRSEVEYVFDEQVSEILTWDDEGIFLND